MKWQMFYVKGQSTRNLAPFIRLHYLRDSGVSAGYVEQTQVREGMGEPAKFWVYMNDGETSADGTEVPDLEAGMALVKILHNPSND